MKKVLFVTYSMEYGGAERALVNLMNELPADRFQIDLLLFRKTGDFLAQLPGWVRVLETPDALAKLYGPIKKAGILLPVKLLGKALSMAVRRNRKAQSAWRWKYLFRRMLPRLPETYDAAVAFSGSEIQYYVADCVSAKRKIVFVHNDYRTAGYSALDDEPYFGQMNDIVSISEKCVEVLREVFPRYQDRMMYLENITSSMIVRERAKAFMPPEYFAGEGIRILSIGRLWAQKGFDLAVEAAALLKAQGVKFQWYIVGEGSLREQLEQQIAELNLQDEFHLLGTRENPYPYIQNCGILVQSSRYEGKSVVLDEAKMLCKPIVATAYPTVADQVADGMEGIVVPMSASGIAEGVRRMTENAALQERIIAYLSAQEYGNQSEVEKYIRLLEA